MTFTWCCSPLERSRCAVRKPRPHREAPQGWPSNGTSWDVTQQRASVARPGNKQVFTWSRHWAFEQPLLTPSGAKISYPCQVSLKLHICEKNECCCCFTPPSLRWFFYTALGSRNKHTWRRHTYDFSQFECSHVTSTQIKKHLHRSPSSGHWPPRIITLLTAWINLAYFSVGWVFPRLLWPH